MRNRLHLNLLLLSFLVIALLLSLSFYTLKHNRSLTGTPPSTENTGNNLFWETLPYHIVTSVSF